jgi:uncharacterized protein YggT (Ycf19 family)
MSYRDPAHDPDRAPDPLETPEERAHADAHEPHAHADETRVVERERYVERPVERPVADYPASSDQVNVNAPAGRTAYAPAGPGPLYYVERVVSLVAGVLAVLLVLRILLLLLAANQLNAIVEFVIGVTEPFVAPFRGVFNIDEVAPGGGSVLDVAAVVAIIGWLLIYLLIMAILRIGDRSRARV